jgi:molybdopterin/thiamine biosynthesis adenylyltransferase
VDVCGNPETIDLIKDTSEKCDLLICTTDTDESRIFVNDISLATGVPSIQAGLHERASSGIVQVVKPGRNACFLCHRETISNHPPAEGAPWPIVNRCRRNSFRKPGTLRTDKPGVGNSGTSALKPSDRKACRKSKRRGKL